MCLSLVLFVVFFSLVRKDRPFFSFRIISFDDVISSTLSYWPLLNSYVYFQPHQHKSACKLCSICIAPDSFNFRNFNLSCLWLRRDRSHGRRWDKFYSVELHFWILIIVMCTIWFFVSSPGLFHVHKHLGYSWNKVLLITWSFKISDLVFVII